MKNPRTAVLECGHHLIFNVMPERAELLLCVRCNDWKYVTETVINYKIRCRDCKYARVFGYNDTAAREYAHNHLKRKPHHTVMLLDGLEIIEEMRNEMARGKHLV